jgi:exonuclease III
MYKETRIGTWNVLTLYKRGALRNVEKVLQEYEVDITTLQEIRWVGEDVLERRGRNIYIIPAKKVNMNLAVDL